MKIVSLPVIVTAANLLCMLVLFARFPHAKAGDPSENTAGVLRGRSPEIVDKTGQVRASITIEPPIKVNGKMYPETVLLRLIDNHRKPSVKLDLSERGAAFGLSDEAEGGIRLIARKGENQLHITEGAKQRTITP